MKRLLILSLVMLAGCSSSQGLTNVQKKIGTSEVINVPGRSYNFIARSSDNAVYYCVSSGIDDDAICAMLFGGR